MVAAMPRWRPLLLAALITACSRAPEPTSVAAEAHGDAPTERPEAAPKATSGAVDAPAETAAEPVNSAEGTSAEGASEGARDPGPPIVDRPIRFDDERRALTLDYRRRHEGGDPQDVTIEPRMVVLHHTGGSSVDAAWRYFDRTKIESGRETLAKAGALNVSAQFVVDRDGTILRLMPENWFARHCVGLNHLAIGVENVGDGKAHPLTEAQVEANAALVRYLAGKYPLTHVIGHHEAMAMREHPYFKEQDKSYRTRKGDPGPAFMAAVRAKIADLGLEGPPAPAP